MLNYNALPSMWKLRISGSINYFITDTYNQHMSLDTLFEYWCSCRLIDEDGSIFYAHSDPNRREIFFLDTDLLGELQEVFRARYMRHRGQTGR